MRDTRLCELASLYPFGRVVLRTRDSHRAAADGFLKWAYIAEDVGAVVAFGELNTLYPVRCEQERRLTLG